MQYDDFNQEQITKTLCNNIKDIDLISEWSDDHIPCASVNITMNDGTKHEKLNLWWFGARGIAAIEYFDSPKARTRFAQAFEQCVNMAIDGGFDYATIKRDEGVESANELDLHDARIVLEMAGININDFECID